MNRILEILAQLIAFDTVSARSNLEMITWVKELLRTCGFDVQRFDHPDAPKAGLLAQIGPPTGGVILSAHSDVVPVEGQIWQRPAFKLTHEENRLYGRGTTDMKGFLAVMLWLAEEAGKARLKERLNLVISYDEEVGCLGIAQMMDELAPALGQPRVCVVGEPTQMQVATGHKGKMGFHALCHGTAGHSAEAPQFTNAIHVACSFVERLRALQDHIAQTHIKDLAYATPYSTIHVGKIKGGEALNIVPDQTALDFELRVIEVDDGSEIVQTIHEAAQEVAERFGPAAQIDIQQTVSYPGLSIAPDHDMVQWVKSHTKPQNHCKVAFGTEAGYFHEIGIPTVVCGPGSMTDQGHKADEFITTDQLFLCKEMLSKILASML